MKELSDKEIFNKIDLSPEEIAKILNVTPRTVYRYKDGSRPLGALAREKLINYISSKEKKWETGQVVLFDWERFMFDHELSQTELAEKLGVQQPYIHRMKEASKEGKPISKSLYDKLYAAFGDEIENYSLTKPFYSQKGALMDVYKYVSPLVDQYLYAGPGVTLVERVQEMDPEAFISVPHFGPVDLYLKVKGDSMYPKYKNGDFVAVKMLNKDAFFAYYEPYAIITKDSQQILIKYIHPHPDDKDKLLLVSYDSNKFPPQEIHRDDIYRLYYIKGGINL